MAKDEKYYNFKIRIDSPRTIQAMENLGIEKEDFIIKTKDNFREEGRTEEVVNLRYNYYVKRYNVTIKSLLEERKKLVKRSQYNYDRPRTSVYNTPTNMNSRKPCDKLQSLKTLKSQNTLKPPSSPQKNVPSSPSKPMHQNLSVPRMQEPGLEQSPADKQYSKILRNFSKEQKVNDQRIKECLVIENRRKILAKKEKKDKQTILQYKLEKKHEREMMIKHRKAKLDRVRMHKSTIQSKQDKKRRAIEKEFKTKSRHQFSSTGMFHKEQGKQKDKLSTLANSRIRPFTGSSQKMRRSTNSEIRAETDIDLQLGRIEARIERASMNHLRSMNKVAKTQKSNNEQVERINHNFKKESKQKEEENLQAFVKRYHDKHKKVKGVIEDSKLHKLNQKTKEDQVYKKFLENLALEKRYNEKRRKELLKNYHKKVNKAEYRKKEIHQQIIARKKELEQIRMENRIENHKREERKMMLKKLTVIEKDVLRDTSKPFLQTDKINKDLLNIKHKNRHRVSSTISKVQTAEPMKRDKIKKIVKKVAPELQVEEFVDDDKEEKKEEDNE
ncbi:unnamed protein product [Moneuplotes crassus]|uniref:Uncharacterized protein n=1 Tax=Euplotes crassus TaxID=5936 RepID=A0AAD1X6K4_EUPCR|nr:unnamed protein product [Moneuplotes crassus]